METILYWLLALILIGGLGVAGYWFYSNYLGNGSNSSGIFGSPRERRLSIVEQANVDGRRRLVIIRRDDVEHLIMTGGPVDIVIETGIGERKSAAPARINSGNDSERAVFGRQARPLGQPGSEG
ncbi:MAG: flagellar biosynthetic protein FliO [Hyphomicrobiaceae bacterium]|nr:flagellar biosynthetic protein FliO [Hyphomicrobiaceae bacterium]